MPILDQHNMQCQIVKNYLIIVSHMFKMKHLGIILSHMLEKGFHKVYNLLPHSHYSHSYVYYLVSLLFIPVPLFFSLLYALYSASYLYYVISYYKLSEV